MDFIKQLMCKFFGHKYKKVQNGDVFTEVWRCTRCGDERRIVSKKGRK